MRQARDAALPAPALNEACPPEAAQLESIVDLAGTERAIDLPYKALLNTFILIFIHL